MLPDGLADLLKSEMVEIVPDNARRPPTAVSDRRNQRRRQLQRAQSCSTVTMSPRTFRRTLKREGSFPGSSRWESSPPKTDRQPVLPSSLVSMANCAAPLPSMPVRRGSDAHPPESSSLKAAFDELAPNRPLTMPVRRSSVEMDLSSSSTAALLEQVWECLSLADDDGDDHDHGEVSEDKQALFCASKATSTVCLETNHPRANLPTFNAKATAYI